MANSLSETSFANFVQKHAQSYRSQVWSYVRGVAENRDAAKCYLESHLSESDGCELVVTFWAQTQTQTQTQTDTDRDREHRQRQTETWEKNRIKILSLELGCSVASAAEVLGDPNLVL